MIEGNARLDPLEIIDNRRNNIISGPESSKTGPKAIIENISSKRGRRRTNRTGIYRGLVF